MSDQIHIDTGKVVAAANRISTLNNEIDSEFDTLETAVGRLNQSWYSRASHVVIDRFYSIKNNFKDSRYKVMQDYGDFLKQPVSEGYNAAETGNTSLSDAFK